MDMPKYAFADEMRSDAGGPISGLLTLIAHFQAPGKDTPAEL